MRSAKLAEAIILQAMDDLYENSECDRSVEFFTGEGFAQCASIAGMDHDSKVGVLIFVGQAVSIVLKPGFRDMSVQGGNGWMKRNRSTGAQGLC